MSQAISKFWNWFSENQENLSQINAPDLDEEEQEEMLDALLDALHSYCDELYFDIGGMHGEDVELIITAEGNTDNFDKVEALIAEAPQVSGWQFIAFMPPRDLDYTSVFEDVELSPPDIWFLPLDSKNAPKSIGLRICLPNYELVKDSKWLKNAVYKVLDIALGEKVFALDVNYIEIKGMPPGKPEDEGLIELKDLARFITWKKKKLASV
jgi:hypothetical protein